jgi:hypothetical protein
MTNAGTWAHAAGAGADAGLGTEPPKPNCGVTTSASPIAVAYFLGALLAARPPRGAATLGLTRMFHSTRNGSARCPLGESKVRGGFFYQGGCGSGFGAKARRLGRGRRLTPPPCHRLSLLSRRRCCLKTRRHAYPRRPHRLVPCHGHCVAQDARRLPKSEFKV